MDSVPSETASNSKPSADTLRQRLALLGKNVTETPPSAVLDLDREVRDLLGLLIEAVPMLVAPLSADGRILHLNPSGCRLLGRTPDPNRIHALTLAELLVPICYEQLLDEILPRARQADSWQGELLLRPQTGKPVRSPRRSHCIAGPMARCGSTRRSPMTSPRKARPSSSWANRPRSSKRPTTP